MLADNEAEPFPDTSKVYFYQRESTKKRGFAILVRPLFE